MANNQIRRRDVDAATWAKLNGDPGCHRQTVRHLMFTRREEYVAPLLAVTLRVPVRVVSEPNERCHWAKRYKRFKKQAEVLGEYLGMLRPLPLPLAITLVKLGGRNMDAQDNLKAAFKGLADFLAAWVGTDDADPELVWLYGQEPGGPHGVRVEFRCLET
jgi:hypothetical protein